MQTSPCTWRSATQGQLPPVRAADARPGRRAAQLRSELQRALDLGQLEIYYQPVVRLEAGTDYGVEALLRWNHPTRGVMAPASFIPLAEETGLIIPIGRWVVYQACLKGSNCTGGSRNGTRSRSALTSRSSNSRRRRS